MRCGGEGTREAKEAGCGCCSGTAVAEGWLEGEGVDPKLNESPCSRMSAIEPAFSRSMRRRDGAPPATPPGGPAGVPSSGGPGGWSGLAAEP